MGVLVTRFCELLLRVLLPARGRHRVTPTTAPPGRYEPGTPAAPVRRQLTLEVRPFEWDTPIVRPYLLTPHERHERKLQRQRRRALWLAMQGIDVGPRRIHGVEVAA
ncbi:hypothetical protein [Streptomyces sp. NPDC050704]|uniref:hypothetical protein n=1 Tax=Streptomyces sp. NPDC050704 TaxID=3157219 RepID=UPI0034287646